MSIAPSARPFLHLALLGRADHARELRDLDRQAGEALRESSCSAGAPAASSARRSPTCLPLIAAAKAARSATSVLPKPTSPQTSRSIGRPAARSSSVGLDRAPPGPRSRRRESARRIRRRGLRAARRRGASRSWRAAAMRMSSPRHLADALLQPRLARLPARAAEPVELRLGVLRAVARQKLEILDRQEQPVAAGIVDLEAIVRRARRLDRLQPDEAADAVVDMDDEIAGARARRFGEHVLRAALALARWRTSRSPRMSCSPMTARSAGLEALLERRSPPAAARRRALLAPARRTRRARPASARARRARGRGARASRRDQPATMTRWPALAQRADMRDRRVEDVGVLVLPLGREIAPRPAAAIDRHRPAPGGASNGADARQRAARRAARAIRPRREIERVRRQRLVIGLGRDRRRRRPCARRNSPRSARGARRPHPRRARSRTSGASAT